MADNKNKYGPFGAPVDIRKAFSTKPELDFVLPGFLTGSTGVIIAPGSTGKSLLSLQIAQTIALGEDVFGIFRDMSEYGPVEAQIKSGTVAIINVEDQDVIIEDRLHSMGEKFSDEEQALIEERLMIFSEVGKNFTIVSKNEQGRLVPSMKLTEAMEFLKTLKPRLVIFDTMNRLSAGVDENSNGDMGLVMSMIENLNRQVGCSSLIVHHANKGSVLSGNSDSQQAGRGASAVTDNARFQINLSTMSKDEAEKLGMGEMSRKSWVRMDYSKVNYGPPRQAVWMMREQGGWLNGNVPAPEELAEAQGLKPKEKYKKKPQNAKSEI